MKITRFLSLTLFVGFASFYGCTKEGVGGTAEIGCLVKHHDTLIPFAKVYIKYDAQESPGTNGSLYDDSLTTDAAAHGHFHDLQKGDYYLFSVGYDSSISSVVSGGLPVKIKAGEVFETEVQVTE
jgi:hypothetical protein